MPTPESDGVLRRGGRRKGAGRKPAGRVQYVTRLREDVIQRVRRSAEREGKAECEIIERILDAAL